MDYSTYALFGNGGNTSAIPADMLSGNADGSTDWNAVLAGGIRGAAQNAIATLVNEKYASGQLVAPPATAQTKTMNLLIVGAIVFVLLKI